MKIKITLLFLFLASFIYAQQTTVYVPVERKLLSWKDFKYQNSFEGLGALMNDVQRLDGDLYLKLKPNYDLLQKRKKEGKTSLIAGSVVGTLLLGLSMKGLLDGAGEISSSGGGDYGTEIGLAVASVAAYSIGGWIYYKKAIKYHDILNFTNQFNEYSEGDKIEISLSPDLNLGARSSAGLALNIRF